MLPNVNTDSWKTVPEVAAQLNLKPHYIRTLAKKWRNEYFQFKGQFGDDISKWTQQPGGIESRLVSNGPGGAQHLVFRPESINTYTKRSGKRGVRNNDGRKPFRIRLSEEELAQLEANMPPAYATLKAIKKYTPKPKKSP